MADHFIVVILHIKRTKPHEQTIFTKIFYPNLMNLVSHAI